MKIKIPGDKAIAVYPSWGRSISVPGGNPVQTFGLGTKWLLSDEFTTALPAGSVNGTAAEPGPGVRTVVDTANKLSISGGRAVFAPNSTNGDPGLWYGAQTIVPGLMQLTKVNRGTGQYDTPIGWDVNQSGVPTVYPYFITGGFILRDQGVADLFVCALVDSTDYYFCIAASATRLFYFIKGGIYTNWIPIYITGNRSGASWYPSAFSYQSTMTKDFIRIPTALWLPVPLLSTSGAMTWPTTNGLGHAEGVAGGLGSGGSGLTMLDAGTWSVAGGYVINTPVAGVEALTNGNMETGDPPTGWVPVTTTLDGVADERTGGSGAQSLSIKNNGGIGGVYRLVTTITNRWYAANCFIKKVDCAGRLELWNGWTSMCAYTDDGNSLTWDFHQTTFRSPSTGINIYPRNRTETGTDECRYDDVSLKPLPISQLITNVQLVTTDVLAEAVIHAFTLGSQAGLAQSDRSFAAKAAATAAAGQAVLSLKEVTGVGGVGLAITDSITIAGTTYTIASVTGGSNVAYNDTTKTQTVTLGANLGAEVLADAKVGLDWAAWNGSLTYFDGSGSIKLDEVKAGVYTNRGSTAKAFAADARLIVRKIGSEYRIFYGEALIGSAISTVDAASMVGKFWGLFSTLAANQITSMCIHDTGNVSNAHGILDKYSRD